MFISMQKMNSIPKFFLGHCKNIANFLLWYFENAWLCPSIILVLPCSKLWCLKSWNQLVGNFDVYLHAKNPLHLLLLFWDIVKMLQTCYFGNFGNVWPSPSKIIVSICRKLPCLLAHKKSTSSSTFFLTYCKEIANLLFWVIWTCLATHT